MLTLNGTFAAKYTMVECNFLKASIEILDLSIAERVRNLKLKTIYNENKKGTRPK